MRGPAELNEAIWLAVALGMVRAVPGVSEVAARIAAASAVLGGPFRPYIGMVTSTGVSPTPQGRPLALSGVAPGMQLWIGPSKMPGPLALFSRMTPTAPKWKAACAR